MMMAHVENILRASSESNTDIHFAQEVRAFSETIKQLKEE